jgi:hypothetical protein
MGMEQWWNDDYQGKTAQLTEKPAPVSLCPPQISLQFTWN